MIIMVFTGGGEIAPHFLFLRCPPIVAAVLCFSIRQGYWQVYGIKWKEVWNLKPSPPTLLPLTRLPNTTWTTVLLAIPLSALTYARVMFSPTYSPLLLCLFPPERSFLAYAFPLLDMCNPCLSYLYLSSFPISALLSTHVLLFLPHHHHHHLYLFSSIFRRKNANPYIPTSFLPCPILFFCKHKHKQCVSFVLVDQLPSLIVEVTRGRHSSMASFGIPRHRTIPLSFLWGLFVS